MSFRCFTMVACCLLLAAMPACNDEKDLSSKDEGAPQKVGKSPNDASSVAKGDDAKATAIMEKAIAYLKSRNSTKVDVTVDVVMQGGGFDQTNSTKCQARFELPNRLAIDVVDDSMDLKAISDGQSLYVAMLQDNKYTVDEAPESFEQIDNPLLGGILQGPIGPAVPGSDLRKSIFAGASGVTYVGSESIGGIPCDRIRYKQADVANDVWVDAGDHALVHKIVQDMSEKMWQMSGQAGARSDFKMVVSFHFNNWDVDSELGLAEMAFTPAAEMEKVDSLLTGPTRAPDATELVGTDAPDFVLESLDGNSIELKSHRGKNIVLLDFWATWCSPCVRAMPTIATVAEAFQEDGVVLYAVNQQESPAQIKSFLKSNKLKVNVALDTDGSVASLYRANAIPQTVIIGKDGRIQAVHIGLLPDLDARLRSELRTLVDGQDLVPPSEAATSEETTDAAKRDDSPGDDVQADDKLDDKADEAEKSPADVNKG